MLIALLLGSAAPAAAVEPGPQQRTWDQISALAEVKRGLSTVEQKLDSRLLLDNRLRADRSLAAALPAVRTGITETKPGALLVDLRVSEIRPDLLAALGAGIRYQSAKNGTVRAEVPRDRLLTLAARPEVSRIEPSGEAWTARAAEPIRSEGVRTHAVDTARERFRVNGTGVKICALSDGIHSVPALQAVGELPAVDVLPGQAGAGDEGSAMLEILHDLAPKAELGFATAFNGDASFADNIRALRFQLKCDVIVDDVLYFNESPFQDGIIARAVNDVTADGALFFSSAGNEGNLAEGTAGHWEGNFVDSGRTIGKFAGTAHDFDPGSATQVLNPLSQGSGGRPATLFWADPLGRSDNDYDLYLFNSNGDVVGFSQNIQDGRQDPYERADVGYGGGRLAVVKYRGADRYLGVSVLRGRFTASAGLKPFATTGVTRGHSAAKDAVSVAATPAAKPWSGVLEVGDPPNPGGPYPELFTATSRLERFSSDGPRRMFFTPDGRPSAENRLKPDLTAADGVQTATPGFSPFFGTSASAPHAAAMAALVLSGNPGMPAAQVRQAMFRTALDLAEPGPDPRAGHGLVQADRLLAATGATPQPKVVPRQPKAWPISGDGDEFLEPGESATLQLPVRNLGDGTATEVRAGVTSATPGIVLSRSEVTYPPVAAGEQATSEVVVEVPRTHPVGLPLRVAVTVRFAGALSPVSGEFTLMVGEPAKDVRQFRHTGAPAPIPDANPAGVTVPIEVRGVGRASSVRFAVDGGACETDPGIAHTFVADLVGTLTAPSGATVTLFERGGGMGDNLCQAVFDDAAHRLFSSAVDTEAPFTGRWRPVTPLGPLGHEPVDGTWKFTVADLAAADTGAVRSVRLEFTGYADPPR
ncbi:MULTISPECIES: S8 family serine peptidase [unclassified Crossiella]|uniref:S8 family serine peptidase n=1 Tax=unclassified Crossiella TaxID=2620835 RepID=UPI001FFF662B|nr:MULTISPECIES: S8 family serine peptidase [unclassified Crossiella]MCK2243030.1 S8 family serine peptidase [Crossiella sp. S99.2]MCK2256907.1 S8 family serine peptidase [Crossiella sp. S99.1]